MICGEEEVIEGDAGDEVVLVEFCNSELLLVEVVCGEVSGVDGCCDRGTFSVRGGEHGIVVMIEEGGSSEGGFVTGQVLESRLVVTPCVGPAQEASRTRLVNS